MEKNIFSEEIKEKSSFSVYQNNYCSPENNIPPLISPLLPQNFVANQQTLNEFSQKVKENGVYDEAIIERKQASFEMLKKWDNHRSHLLHLHSKFVENLINRLNLKIEFSNNFMHKIVKFFKEKVIQESEYAVFIQNRLPKFSQLFNETSIEIPGIYKGFSEIDEMHAKKIHQLEIYVGYIEKTIIKEILNKENSEFNKKISSFKEKFQEIKKNLNRINVETAEKSTKYSKAFYEMIEPPIVNKLKKHAKDLLNLELNFLKIAEVQSELHKEMGKETVAFWKEVMKLEINRLFIIQKVMLNYLVQSENHKGSAKNEFQTLDPIKEIEVVYSLNNLFAKDELLFLEKFKEEGCFDFLENIRIERFKEDHLILKEILLERDHGNALKEFKPCLIVFTIDNNLLIFDEPTKEYNPANFSLRVEGIHVLPREEERIVEISVKVVGFLFDSKNRFVFRFENNDKVEEFVNYFNFVNLKKI